MKKTFATFLALTASATVASADVFCIEADYACISPTSGLLLITSPQPVVFCSINTDMTKEELIEKIGFYERCNSLNGVVISEVIK